MKPVEFITESRRMIEQLTKLRVKAEAAWLSLRLCNRLGHAVGGLACMRVVLPALFLLQLAWVFGRSNAQWCWSWHCCHGCHVMGFISCCMTACHLFCHYSHVYFQSCNACTRGMTLSALFSDWACVTVDYTSLHITTSYKVAAVHYLTSCYTVALLVRLLHLHEPSQGTKTVSKQNQFFVWQ